MSAPRRARRFDDDHDFDDNPRSARSGRAPHEPDDDPRRGLGRRPAPSPHDADDSRRSAVQPDGSPGNETHQDAQDVAWSTYRDAQRGPEPVPDWLVVDPLAIDEDRGVLKTGKEAEVSLVERFVRSAGSAAGRTSTGPVPGDHGRPVPTDNGRGSTGDRRPIAADHERFTGDGRRVAVDREFVSSEGPPRCLLAAKRYRGAEHRLFHRDAGYLEGRRVRRSREMRAMRTRTAYGKELIAGQWAAAEFAVLSRLWLAGAAVPYPVQLLGTELMMEFVGDADGTGAPRLAESAPSAAEAADLYVQLVDALVVLAEAGYTHGDLSPYNVLNHHGRLVLIDLPQAVDLVGNPQGFAYLERDCENICRWFAARGVTNASGEDLGELLSAAAVSGHGR